jgi:hypothetical protein
MMVPNDLTTPAVVVAPAIVMTIAAATISPRITSVVAVAIAPIAAIAAAAAVPHIAAVSTAHNPLVTYPIALVGSCASLLQIRIRLVLGAG